MDSKIDEVYICLQNKNIKRKLSGCIFTHFCAIIAVATVIFVVARKNEEKQSIMYEIVARI